MTDHRALRPHLAKIEERLSAETERIEHEFDDLIHRVRQTITTSVTRSTAAIPRSDRAALRLVVSNKPPSADALYWSSDGIVACANHAPRPAEPRHRSEDWRPVLQGRWYLQCQFCHGTPIKPATRGTHSHQ